LVALDARVVLSSADGESTIPLASLYQDDGISYLHKKREEILTQVLVPTESDNQHCSSSFWKLRRRGSIDFAVFSCAAALWLKDGTRVSKARIVLGAVSSAPLAVSDAARLLEGHQLDDERIREAARLARRAATPVDNTDFRTQWRGVMVERYTEAALREAGGLPQVRFSPPHPL
jgi:CO/xanthine dehydrogenase FAD-binding subunit